MESEDTWSGPVTKAARKAEKKAEQELWQALESLDLRDARESAKEVAKKEKEKKVISKSTKSCHREVVEATPNKSRNPRISTS